MMLTPQYSVRHLFLVVTLCAVVCLVPAVAVRGYLWAIATSVALLAAIVLLLVGGLMYTVTRWIDVAFAGRRIRAAERNEAP